MKNAISAALLAAALFGPIFSINALACDDGGTGCRAAPDSTETMRGAKKHTVKKQQAAKNPAKKTAPERTRGLKNKEQQKDCEDGCR